MKGYEIKPGMCLGVVAPCPSEPNRVKLRTVSGVTHDEEKWTIVRFRDTSDTLHVKTNSEVLL